MNTDHESDRVLQRAAANWMGARKNNFSNATPIERQAFVLGAAFEIMCGLR